MEYGSLQTDRRIGPQCIITVVNPSDRNRSVSIRAIIDTGAAQTCIRESTFQELGTLIQGNPVSMRDANNGLRDRDVYAVHITIADFTFEWIEAIELPDRRNISKNYALVGRDILNQSKIVLDAAQRQWRLNCQQDCDQLNIMNQSAF